jgi:hypothetical protein
MLDLWRVKTHWDRFVFKQFSSSLPHSLFDSIPYPSTFSSWSNIPVLSHSIKEMSFTPILQLYCFQLWDSKDEMWSGMQSEDERHIRTLQEISFLRNKSVSSLVYYRKWMGGGEDKNVIIFNSLMHIQRTYASYLFCNNHNYLQKIKT